MEIKFRDEVDKVPRIKHLGPDFHKVIKEPLTCRILQSQRLTPQPVFAPGHQRWPPHALKVALDVAFHPSITSHLHDSHHLLAGFLFPPLLHFSKVTPLKPVRSHFSFVHMPPNLPIPQRKGRILTLVKKAGILATESVGWDPQWPGHPLGSC